MKTAEPPVTHTAHGLGQLTVFTRAIGKGDDRCLGEVTLKDADGRSVAGITIRPDRTDARHIAVGHLFAGAGAMLAACQFAHSVITSNGVFETSERLAIEKLEAAIALARGGAASAEVQAPR